MKKTFLLILCLFVLLGTVLSFASCHKEKQYDVVYMVDGVQYSKLSTSGNRVFPLPPEPTKNGYIFKGWFYDEDYYLEPFDNTTWENTPLLSNITVYAKWKSEGACPDGTCIPGPYSLVKEPSCSQEGVEQATCIECSEILSRTVETLPHTPDEEPRIENVVAATCDKEGSYDTVTVCQDCGEELSRVTTSTEKTEHIPKAAVKEKIHDSTCTEDGSYQSVVYCRNCKSELSREDCTIEKKNHSEDTNVCEMCHGDFLIYEYSEELDGYIVCGVSQTTYTSVVIPSKHEGKAVRAIGENAFSSLKNLKKIEIPFNVTVIGENAFQGCDALEHVTYHGKLAEWQAVEIGEGNGKLTAITPYCTNNFTDWMPF